MYLFYVVSKFIFQVDFLNQAQDDDVVEPEVAAEATTGAVLQMRASHQHPFTRIRLLFQLHDVLGQRRFS